MNYNSIIISMILGIIFFDVLGNDKLEMKCMITEELEKNKPAINKNYTEKDIKESSKAFTGYNHDFFPILISHQICIFREILT